MLSSDIKALYESYKSIYQQREEDDIPSEMIEEIIEELVEECLEFGYSFEESIAAIEEAAVLYFDAEDLEEAKVTYGRDTESPEQKTARAKERLGGMKSAARKAAVKSAVSKVKSKAAGAAAGAVVGAHTAAASAKDKAGAAVAAAKKAGSAVKAGAQKAGAAVSAAAKEKKAQVKTGVKKMLGKGLRAVAGGAGKVAQVARKAGSAAGKAASRLGEDVEQIAEISADLGLRASKAADRRRAELARSGDKSAAAAKAAQASRLYTKQAKIRMKKDEVEIDEAKKMKGEDPCWKNYEMVGTKMKDGKEVPNCVPKEEVEIFDVVLEYLLDTGHAETISEAKYIMSQMDQETIESIVEETLQEKLKPGTRGKISFATGKQNFDQKMTEKNPRTGRQRATSPELKAIGAHGRAKSAQYDAENRGDTEAAKRNRTRREKIAHTVYRKTGRIIDRADND